MQERMEEKKHDSTPNNQMDVQQRNQDFLKYEIHNYDEKSTEWHVPHGCVFFTLIRLLKCYFGKKRSQKR